MTQLVEAALHTLNRLDLWSILDILVVAVIIYGMLGLFRGTSAFSVLYGIVLLMAAVLIVSGLPQLVMLNWLLRNILPFLSMALLILFQPELRRAMERIGRVRSLLNRPLGHVGLGGMAHAIEEIARACRRLAERRQGALIVMERETGLQEYADSGIEIDGAVSMELLLTIFAPNTPLHDGAVILRGDRVTAASCVLPLTQNTVDYALGTRHRAAIGITEQSDAVSVVVSEETGTISLANNGRIVRNLDEAKLRKILELLFHRGGREPPTQSRWPWQRAVPVDQNA